MTMDEVAKEIKALLELLSDTEREAVMTLVVEGYCPACWRKVRPGEPCHCENEE